MLEALGGLVGVCVRGGFGGGGNVVLLWRVKKPHSSACPRPYARGLRAEVDIAAPARARTLEGCGPRSTDTAYWRARYGAGSRGGVDWGWARNQPSLVYTTPPSPPPWPPYLRVSPVRCGRTAPSASTHS